MTSMLIGLTGSMGAGKSEASRAFSRLGAIVYDADILGHFAIEKITSVREQIGSLLGSEAFGQSGRPDRKFIASKVFADKRLLCAYENILHPAIRNLWTEPLDYNEYLSFINSEGSDGSGSIYKRAHPCAVCESASQTLAVLKKTEEDFPALAPRMRLLIDTIAELPQPPLIVEAALLFEKNLEKDFEFCIDVLCSNGLRHSRLEARGMNSAEISSRDAFQFPPEKKASLADAVLFNESSKSFLQIQAALCLSRLF